MKKSATSNRTKGRKHLSGAAKRKKKEENVASENKLLSEIPKITSLFRARVAGDNDDGASSSRDGVSQANTTGDADDVRALGDNYDSPGDVLVEEESATDDETVREATSLHEIPADFTCGDGEAVGNIAVEQSPDSDTSVETAMPVNYPNDTGLWPSDIDECFRDHWLEKGSSECRHATTNFEKSAVKKENDHPRYCNVNFFSRVHPKTGERLEHNWLCYSESAGKLFCFMCRLMSDKHLVDELEREITYWRAVLMRVLDVLKFLCERGLAIRGKDETIGSVHNGNFLGIMELLSLYDPFLKRHLDTYGNKGKGTTSYLSHTICDELIKIMADKVMATIIQELQQCKYFSISVDSTPDITHTDQLSVTIQYVLPTGPVERFLIFVPISDHIGEGIADVVLKLLKEKSIDIKYCRGQSYDDASNMSGNYNGVQSRIKCVCSYADFCPCCAHSLNLVGTCAVESCSDP